jgi:predicted phosphate transport protein (TIGR00153 family)
MPETRSLLHWFRTKANIKVKEKILQHANSVKECCHVALELYHDLPDKSYEVLIEKIDQINKLEEEADTIQDELANDISRGILPPNIQEDLFRMVRRFDATANWVKTSTKNIHLGLDLKLDFPRDLISFLYQLTDLTYKSAILVVEMIELLGLDDQSILEKRIRIEKYEREADSIFYKAKENVLIMGKSENVSLVYLSLDTAKSLENASDMCSEAADFLYSLVMSGPVT